MAKIKHKGTAYNLPNIKFFRNGHWQPRFEPSKSLRQAGWKGHALKDENGDFLDRDAAIARAIEIMGEIESWRAGQSKPAPDIRPHYAANTLGRILDNYRHSPEFTQDISPATRREYEYNLRAIERILPLDVRADAFDRPAVKAFYNKMRRDLTLSAANHNLAVMKIALNVAMDDGLIGHNPVLGFRMVKVKPRVRFVEQFEIEAFVKTADDMGLFTLGSMVIAGLITGQRQADINRLPITLPNNELDHSVRQGKRGKIVNLPSSLLDILRVRLTAQAAHARKISAASPTRLFIRESTAKPYKNRGAINKDFLKVRAEAQKTCPSLAGLNENGGPTLDKDGQDMTTRGRFTYSDLRDTALTTLILAGCTISEACAIIGHDEASAVQTWKHYLAQRPEMAENAGRKVAEYCEANGISY